VAWTTEQVGVEDAAQRVTEGPAAFLVQLDGDFADSTIVVRKRTGEYWHIAADQGVHAAKNDRRLRRAIRKVVPFASQPAGVVPAAGGPAVEAGLTRAQLAAWLQATHGWRHIDSRISDLGWAFSVSTQPDLYHDGNRDAMTFGNGPLIVARRTGEVWTLSSTPDMVPAFSARTRQEFRRVLAKSSYPGATDPDEWIRF
jgi:hypothetical protein